MLTQKETAEVYRLGLVIGMFEVQEVVSWADKVIETDDDPDYALIEVSMAGDENEGKVASLLNDVGGDANVDKARHTVLGLLGRRLKDGASADQVKAQVEALEKGEEVSFGLSGDLGDALGQYDGMAAEWLA